MTNNRPPLPQRRFHSPAVEEVLRDVCARIADTELAWLFTNSFPNTLDTTVTTRYDTEGKPDTFVITGDIDAMWLRDSTAQVWPYLPFAKDDGALRSLLQGVLNRQVRCVLLDPYANAFYQDGSETSEWVSDRTEMRPGVHERKYELDSLCSVLRLSLGYWEATQDPAPFNAVWNAAMERIVQTIRLEQAGTDETAASPYRFQRRSDRPTETLAMDGQGQPRPPLRLEPQPVPAF